jgi:hypothetical protein
MRGWASCARRLGCVQSGWEEEGLKNLRRGSLDREAKWPFLLAKPPNRDRHLSRRNVNSGWRFNGREGEESAWAAHGRATWSAITVETLER